MALPVVIRAAALQRRPPAPGSSHSTDAKSQMWARGTACNVLPSEGSMAAAAVWLK